MKSFVHKLAALSFFALIAAVPAVSHAERVAKVVPDYTVFVDPPTGFVFVKLPEGWKFVGKVEPKDLSRLPATVETALLTGSDDADEMKRMAQQQAR